MRRTEWQWERVVARGRQPSCRNCHTATLFQNYMVIFGGKEGEGRKRLVNDLHILDLDTTEWLPSFDTPNPAPDPRMGHSALLVGSRILIYGGWNGTRVLFDCYQLDLSHGVSEPTWSELRTCGEAPRRQFHTANCVKGKMLVFGGGDGKSWLNDLYALDLQSLEWTKISTRGLAPVGRLQHVTITVCNSLYVFGGEPGRQRQLNDLHILDTATMEWTEVAASCLPAPTPRVSTTSCTVGRTIYFFGGYDGSQWLCDIQAFDTAQQEWIPVSVCKEGSPDPRCRHTSLFYKGKMVIFGGNDCDRSFNDLFALVFPSISAETPQLSRDLEWLLTQELLADVVFEVQGSKIAAHRCVLACRSEHFRAMLTGGMMETSAREIPLMDLSPLVFRSVLSYIYTDRVEIRPEYAIDLLIAANRFCLPQLKSLTEEFLGEMLSIGNIVDLLVIAKRHQADFLLKRGIEYASEHLEAVRKLPDLGRLSKSIMLQLLKEGK